MSPKLTKAGPSRPIFAIFEGGGAKGVAHVGALKAIEQNGLDIVGVAGTSAGALLAAMTAIGFEADDIMSGNDPAANIIVKNGETPTSILGDKEWKRFRYLLKRGKFSLIFTGLFGVIIGALISPRIMATILGISENLGHFSTKKIEQFVNRVIRERLSKIKSEAGLDWEISDQITFGELGRGWPTVIPLKIIATDVDNGTLEIFDAFSTPDVVVSQAVAASIAIPLVFKPAKIPSFRSGCFADGGLVSNLPIWGFVEEKLGYEREHYEDPPVPIVGFSLSAPDTREHGAYSPTSLFPYIRHIINAALQGSQGTANRFLEDEVIIPLESPLDMLAFDADWEMFRRSREAGRVSANNHLRFILKIKPDRIENELKIIRTNTLKLLNKLRIKNGKPRLEKIRVNLIRPFGTHSLRVMESLDMAEDADDRLILDRRGRGSATAFRERGLRVFRFGNNQSKPELDYMTKYERALVRNSVKTVICVPIFKKSTAWDIDEVDRPEPAGVLTIDSDDTIYKEFQDNNLWDMLVQQSAILYAAVNSEVGNG